MATIITKTIGQDGWQDFSAIQQATDAITTSDVANTADLVAADKAVVFEIYAGTYTEDISINEGLTCDATRNVTYKSAAGNEHGGVEGAGVVLTNSSGRTLQVSDKHVHLEGIEIRGSTDRAIFLNRTKGTVIDSCIILGESSCNALFAYGIEDAESDVIQNCRISAVNSFPVLVYNDSILVPAKTILNNNTIIETNSFCFRVRTTNASATVKAELNNNLCFGSVLDNLVVGTNVITGVDNVGGPTSPVPLAQQADSQTWTFSTSATAPSTGSQVIYDDTTYKLLNLSGNDAVGVGDGTVAPTTDIQGNARIRGAANEYADPGAFSTELITATRTIGKGGWQDFTTFTAAEAEADAIANELLGGTRENLAQRNGSIVFEAGAGTYSESVSFQSSLTTDATRNVTYKPAVGSEHGGDKDAGVIIDGGLTTTPINLRDSHTVMQGLNVKSGVTALFLATTATGRVLDGLLVGPSLTTGGYSQVRDGADQTVFRNCVFRNTGAWCVNFNPALISGGNSCSFLNCTFSASTTAILDQPAVAATLTLTNNLFLTGAAMSVAPHANTTRLGGGNVTHTALSQTSLLASNQTWTFSTDPLAAPTGSQVIYDATNGALLNVPGNDAVGVGDGTVAPTTDINGNARIRGASNEYADPGAFSTDLITATKIIDINEGPGYDYSGFIEAEDDAEEVAHELLGGTRENLAQRNGAIVFEARAGTYNGQVTIQHNSIISDATRNVTYKAAVGSEHGGLSSAGVRIDANGSSRAITVHSNFARFEGIVFVGGTTYSAWLDAPGVVARNCIAAFINRGFVAYDGTPTHPIVMENCVSRGGTSHSFLVFSDNAGGPTHARLINCVGETTTTTDTFRSQVNDGITCEAEYINCLSLGSRTHQAIRGPIVTGSNNVGGTLNRWPEATRAEGQVWTFTTSATAPSTGSQVIYTSATGALINVSGNDAVGVGTGTGAPTTDILGNSRIRGADNEYADPGAFTTDLITATKIIDVNLGPGYDYSDFVDAEDDVEEVAHELLGGTRENLAQRNGSIVFEARAGIYPQGSRTFDSGLIADPSRNVTYKGTGDVTISSTGVLGNSDDFTVFDGIDINSTVAAFSNSGRQAVLKNCTVTAGTHAVLCTNGASLTCDNVLTDANNYSFYASNNTDSTTTLILRNCTVVRSQTAVPIRLQSFNPKGIINTSIDNCLLLNTASQYYDSGDPGTLRLSGGGNVGGAVTPFPSGLRAEGQTWTFSTSATAPSTGNQVIYTSATGALLNVSGNDAIGVGDGTQAPTTDINGVSRIRGANNEYTDPGAFSTEKVTFTKKIGPYREYTTFTDAESAVVSISTNGNLAERNEAIVFEADAGTYSENFSFYTGGAITCDPTRNVTWKNGLGSEHGGQFEGGVNIVGSCTMQESFAVVDGFSINTTTAGAGGITLGPIGVILRNLMSHSTSNRAFTLVRGGSAAFPGVVENCVGKSDGSRAFDIRSDGAESHWRIINCTAITTGINQGFIIGQSSSYTVNLELVNNVVNGGTVRSYFSLPGPTILLTGSNNVGPDDGSAPFPAAVQAEGQTWTTTTNTTAAPTGNQVVYEAATGKMLAVSGNDAIGIGTLSAAPTTDINGTSRLRGVGTQYVDPGAFTSDVNTITRTIGIGGAASGFDFGSFLQAEAAVDTTAVTYSNNLAEKNIAIVFEAAAGTYEEEVHVSNSLVCGPTNNVIFQGEYDGGTVIQSSTTGKVIRITNGAFTHLKRLKILSTGISTSVRGLFIEPAAGVSCEGILIDSVTFENNVAQYFSMVESNLKPTASIGGTGSETHPIVIQNCFGKTFGGGIRVVGIKADDIYVKAVNCSFISNNNSANNSAFSLTATGDIHIEILNCITTGFRWSYRNTGAGSVIGTGSNNLGDSYQEPFPTALQAEGQLWTFTTDIAQPSTGDQVIYTSATGALVNVSGNDAIGVGTGSAINVPANDILGKSRLRGLSNEYVDPGAFTTDIETTTLTANPGTLSAIIDNLTPYITTTNIAKRNESIVIELEKADYPHLNTTNNENIIGDSVRNITIKPEEGAHHKGIRGAGIRFISANTSYDTFSLQNVKGFTLEGVELYTPADDIGRYLTVNRFSDAILYKDVILNTVECAGRLTTQSWYNNGRLSPVSFRNCLFLTNQGCFTVGTVTAQENQGTYEFTNCTLSGLAASRSIWQVDAVHSGTFNVNLTNNLILSDKRNIGNRWINETGGFFGDVFVYGRNNTGPDTPNYQLPTAVRATLYPIEPTTDYTPVPSSPAAVYRAATFQLLDVPENDILQIGVGTSDSDVPAEGIGGEARSTSSCNPGCWEDLYELVDLEINTIPNTPGFRNRLFGPSTDVANVALPDDAVPIFIIVGDSTSQGFCVTSPSANMDAESYKGNTAYWPTNAYDGSDVGYFWNKFMTSNDNGATWVKSYPDYVTTDSSGDAFLPLHPRLGGISYGTFTYSVDPDPTQLAAVGNCSPIWDFALDISGIFRRSSGENVPPRFVYLGLPQARLGSNGPDVGGFTDFNFSPDGFLYNTLLEAYIKPAVDSVLNEGKNPVLVGVLLMIGGAEANIAYNPNASGDKVSTSGAQTYINFLAGITDSCNLNGRYPHIVYEVWDTLANPTNYPQVYTKLMRDAMRTLKDIHINRHTVLQDLQRDKIGGAVNSGVHFLQKEYVRYGRRFGQEYRSLLSMNKYPIYARTLSDIFD